MKYLFEAIDARQGRGKVLAQNGGGAARGQQQHAAARPRPDPVELKRLIVEASEGLDDKSSATEFVDTLERIVNEIRNTTEHSQAFLQKVRKTDVPDYYDIIKRPMDLATLLKRVKQQTYRTKKAFAEDLDLIWSNCLLYNSHPSHPLRRSAEILRQKSNQLLEFISDPALPARSIFSVTLGQEGRGRASGTGSNRGTPGIGADADDENEGDVESDHEMAAGLRAVQQARMWTPGSEVASALPNGLNGDRHARSHSPATPRAGTPGPGRSLSRQPSRAFSHAPTPPPPPPPEPDLAFEERPAIVRTPQSMQDFMRLDEELERLEAEFGWEMPPPRPLLPPSSEAAASNASSSQALVRDLVQSLKPAPQSQTRRLLTNGDVDNSADTTDTEDAPTPVSTAAASTSLPSLKGDELPHELWWEVVGPSGSPFTSTVPRPATVIAAGLPSTPWQGIDSKDRRKRRRKDEVTPNGTNGVSSRRDGKAKTAITTQEVPGLGGKMRKNFETLRQIRKLHTKLARTSRGGDGSDSQLPILSEEESEGEDTKPARPAAYLATGLPRSAFRSALAPRAAGDSMAMASNRILGHVGFEGASQSAVNVLAQVAAEYVMNLGRTLRFYSDRYGDKMPTEQMLLHALGENGVPSPSDLDQYVSEDIDRYGVKLADLHAKLDRARREQIDGLEDAPEGKDDELLARDGEALASGEISSVLGEDCLGLADSGLSDELGTRVLAVPLRLYRGEAIVKGDGPPSSPTDPVVLFPPPPPFPHLTPDAIASQIGLLQPYFSLRQSTTDHGLVEDFALPASRPKSLQRPKVPPSGRIPVKSASGRRRAGGAGDDPDAPVVSKKKRKKAPVPTASTEDEG